MSNFNIIVRSIMIYFAILAAGKAVMRVFTMTGKLFHPRRKR